MDRRNFIKFSSIAACTLGAGIIYSGVTHYFGVSYDIQKKLKNKKDFIPQLDIHLVEHCNLNCKYCSHFSCIAEPEFLNIKDYEKDIKRLYEITQGKSKGFMLIGGEPLLHPNLLDFISITRKIFPETYIEISTNGILLNSMEDKFWQCMHDNSVALKHSWYPNTNVDIDKYYEQARKFRVRTFFKQKDLPFRDKFIKYNLDLEGKVDNIKRFEECSSKKYCKQLSKGKIYDCCIGPGIRHFNKKFNKNIKIVESDYIDIYKAKDIGEIFKFFETPPNICKYCGYIKEEEVDWESSPVHDISEWTYS